RAYEELRRLFLTGHGIRERDAVAEVDERLLARPVMLAHHDRELALELAVELGEPRVGAESGYRLRAGDGGQRSEIMADTGSGPSVKVSAMRSEYCPPCRRSGVRHQVGIVSAMARNTQSLKLGGRASAWGGARSLSTGSPIASPPEPRTPWTAAGSSTMPRCSPTMRRNASTVLARLPQHRRTSSTGSPRA